MLTDKRVGRIDRAFTGPVLVEPPSVKAPFRDDVTLARWLPGTLSDFATQRAQRWRFTAAVMLFGAFVTMASGTVALLAP
jgi:hypothetical protein